MKIAYYPSFNKNSDLVDQYLRALWYLPFNEDINIEFHISGKFKVDLDDRPEHFYTEKITNKNFHLQNDSKINFFEYLDDADYVLCWDANKFDELKELKLKKLKSIFKVDPKDLASKEFGVYPQMYWKICAEKERKEFIKESHKILSNYIERNKFDQKAVLIAGTGPSADKLIGSESEYEDHWKIVCNSYVKSKWLSKFKPNFITAGDAVSHFGVARYAEVFRKDLIKFLRNNKNTLFFTTDRFGVLFKKHYPDVSDQIVGCPQTRSLSYDLVQKFELPALDSTLNIHMLPLASSLSDHIKLIGFDSKSPVKEENEDFWAHSSNFQYHDLVETGLVCHPSFDILRKMSTYSGFISSTYTQMFGLKGQRKKVEILTPTFNPALRFLDE